MSIPTKDGFNDMISDNKGIIYKISNAYCKDQEERKDLVQEIIIHLWKSFDSYDSTYKASTWIYRIALNVAISYYRKERTRKKKTSSFAPELICEQDLEECDGREQKLIILHQFVNTLDELNRALIILYLEDKPYREIADILGISETNVGTKIGRIKEKLRKHFQTIKHD